MPNGNTSEPRSSSIVKVSAGPDVRMSVERSDSPIDPTEVIINRKVSEKRKNAKKKKVPKSARVRHYSASLEPKLIRLKRTNRVVPGHAVAVRDTSRGKPLTHFVEN